MLNELVEKFLSLYHSHMVKVFLKDNQIVEGIITVTVSEGIEINGKVYAMDQVEDILYVGTLSDYHTFSNIGVIDGVYKFDSRDCLNLVEFEQMVYHEHEYRLSCHLEIRQNAIWAVDVSMLQKVHVLNESILAKERALYIFADGRQIVGTLNIDSEEPVILTKAQEKVFFSKEDVVDITRPPVINDIVTVKTMKDKVVSGIVSAVQDDYLLIISDMLPQMVYYSELKDLCYQGVVTGNGLIDSIYRYKLPFYLKDKTQEELIYEGVKVSYIAGVNSRYWIAKDIELVDSAKKKTQKSVPNRYGVILTVEMSKPDGVGYIGSEYRSKVCGDQQRGKVRFKRGQIPFEYDYNKIYIVRYSVRDLQGANGLFYLSQMELVETADYAKISIVRVDEDGRIESIPIYRAVPRYYENREVDVVCHTGVYSGVLIEQESEGILIRKIGGTETEKICYDEIENVRIKGKVTKYNANGTGYIDNIYFFHINDISNISTATKIREGVLLSFELRNTRKASGYSCTNIDVIGETLDGYVISYQEGIATVVAEEEYEKNSVAANRYSIYMEKNESFPALDKYDYHATFTLRVNGNRRECISIRVGEGIPKILDGYATALNDGIIRIVSAEQYETEGGEVSFFLVNVQEVQGRLKNIEYYDYAVKYRTYDRNTVEVAFVGETREKIFYGYIDTYYNDRQFGYITPNEYYGKKTFVERLKEDIDVWCRPSAFENAPNPLDTSQFTYYVRYMLDYSTHNVKAPARSVVFLNSRAKNQKAVASTVARQEKKFSIKEDTVNLRQEYGEINTEGKSYRYGILAGYSASLERFKIIEAYCNKKYCDEDFVNAKTNTILVETAKVSVRTIEKIVTVKFVYIVRYVGGEGGRDGESTVNYEYPIDIIEKYSKNQTQRLEVDGGMLKRRLVEHRPVLAVIKGKSETEQEYDLDKVPGFNEGETLFYKAENGEFRSAEFAYEDEESVYLKDGQILDIENCEIWRLGVLTDFDSAFQVGCLNEGLHFNFSVMESKTFNIAKTGKKSMLLSYKTEGGQVVYVEKMSQEMLGQIPWTQGTVTDFLVKDKSRIIQIDGEIKHYLSVLTDGLVSRLAKNDSLIGKKIYIRQINCPVWSDQNEGEIVEVASDVHCEEEEAIIRYDVVRDKYMAYRDQTHCLAVKGNAAVLQKKVDTTITVYFAPDETRMQLEAYLEKGDSYDQSELEQEYEDMESEQSTAIIDSALGQHCLKQVNLRKMELPKKTDLDDEGWPVSKSQAVKLMENLCTKSPKSMAAANMIAAAAIGVHMGIPRVKIFYKSVDKLRNIETLLRMAFKRRIDEIIRDVNGMLGEYTYYITALLRESQNAENKCEYLYRLFSQDYYTRLAIKEELDTHKKHDAEALNILFSQKCSSENARNIVAHIMPLDEQSAEFLFNMGVIQENAKLSQAILEFGTKIDDTAHFDDSVECLKALRLIYQQDKRRFLGENNLGGERGDVCRQCDDVLKKMLLRFCKLMCQDDWNRFQRFSDCCSKVVISRTAGFSEREKVLKDAYRDICELDEDVREHPTQQALEMLEKNRLFRKVREEITDELNELYHKERYYPDIRCYSNEYEVLREQKSILFLVENGDERVTNKQTVQDLTFFFEPITEGVSISGEIKLSQKELPAGTGSCVLEVPIDLSDLEGDSFSIAWSAEYQFLTGFNGALICDIGRKECAEPINFQLLQNEIRIEKRDVANPYKTPANGQPLKTNEMFFGRKTEFKEIWDYIVTPEKELIPGRAILVYGQKKCGKTSLINQIKNRLEEEEKVRDQAIIIDIDNILMRCGGPNNLSYFTLNFYFQIFNLLKDEIDDKHPDVEEMLEREGLVIPDLSREEVAATAPTLFQQFFLRFRKLDRGMHKIVLVMDEFTLFCTAITQKLSEHPEYQYIPDFIKMLSGMDFIQIIVGHAAMMRSLSQLGVINHTAEFAKKIEISAIKRDDGRDLIRKPMEKCFGRDVYQTPLGKRAIEKLLDLAGCSPSVLMKLCDRMFCFFVNNDRKNQLIDVDVDAMVKAYLADGINTETFDMLLTEDGDEVAPDEERPTYLYLKHIIQESIQSNNHDCDFGTVCGELGTAKSNETREILLDRRVLSMGNGRIRLNMWLFAEFIRYKYGM